MKQVLVLLNFSKMSNQNDSKCWKKSCQTDISTNIENIDITPAPIATNGSIYTYENCDIAIAMSSSLADPVLGLNILLPWLGVFKSRLRNIQNKANN